MCNDFINKAMRKPVARHYRLLNLVKDIAEDYPLTALRLLQVCGSSRIRHVIFAGIIRQFAESRDTTVVRCLEAV